MIKSMTGFGRAECVIAGTVHKIEMKSVNSKGLDLSVKMPSYCRALETKIRSILTAELRRGKVEVFVNASSGQDASATMINKEVLSSYFNTLKESIKELGVEVTADALLGAVVRMPEVMSTSAKSEMTEAECSGMLSAVESAAKAMSAHREEEGVALLNDIMTHIATIGSLLVDVEQYEGERIERVRTRLAENLEKAKAEIDKSRFEAEIIYYLEKFDVTEEKVRLVQHLDYFEQVARGSDEVGRKLGFIAQEIGREINTLGSKANHAEMQRIVVQMKDALEKIKEQTLNLL